MSVFLARRLLALFLTLLGASLAVFFILEVLPGDPATVMLGIGAQEDTLAALRKELGLDKPAWERYFLWILGWFQGDLGNSYAYDEPVTKIILERLRVSLPLALIAITLSTAIGLPLGVLAAAKRNSLTDVSVMGFVQVGVAIPNFWFAILMILFFSVFLKLVPAGGFAGWDAGTWPALKSLILPAVALALPQAAILARVTRSSVLEVMREDYVRTARAKGLTFRSALWRHAVRNALIPVVTIIALDFGYLFSGALITETIFAYPGMGKLIFDSIIGNDFNLALVALLFATLLTLIGNLLADLAYVWLDPRISFGGAER